MHILFYLHTPFYVVISFLSNSTVILSKNCTRIYQLKVIELVEYVYSQRYLFSVEFQFIYFFYILPVVLSHPDNRSSVLIIQSILFTTIIIFEQYYINIGNRYLQFWLYSSLRKADKQKNYLLVYEQQNQMKWFREQYTLQNSGHVTKTREDELKLTSVKYDIKFVRNFIFEQTIKPLAEQHQHIQPRTYGFYQLLFYPLPVMDLNILSKVNIKCSKPASRQT